MDNPYRYGTLEYKVFMLFHTLKERLNKADYSDDVLNIVSNHERYYAMTMFLIYFGKDVARMGLGNPFETSSPDKSNDIITDIEFEPVLESEAING